MKQSDTSERGLERLICTALTGSVCEPCDRPASEMRERAAAYAACWICSHPEDYDREYCVDFAQLAAFLRKMQLDIAEAQALDDDGPTRRKFLARLQGAISSGIVKDRNRLYWEDFKRMPSCFPPPLEQVEIADAIDAKCRQIDESTYRVRRELSLLREHRTRLIADLVTGKLDVRDAVARLNEGKDPEPFDEADAMPDVEESTVEDLDAVPGEAQV